MSEQAYADQYLAAVAETSGLMKKARTTESLSFASDGELPEFIEKTISRLSEKLYYCGHICDLGPRPLIVYVSHSMYVYCIPCGTTGDALKIRQAETKFTEHCYYCGCKQVGLMQAFAMQYENVLYVGDLCRKCALEAGLSPL